jgi:uncharacterized membrane protein YphA (DoxX/SURF4 family)
MKAVFQLLGRVCIAAVFVTSVIGNARGFAGIQAYMAGYAVPATGFFLSLSIVVRVAGSALLILGYETEVGVALLALFLIPVTLIFHTNFNSPVDLVAFMENIGLFGGLLMLGACGPGRLSMDEKPVRHCNRARYVHASRGRHSHSLFHAGLGK